MSNDISVNGPRARLTLAVETATRRRSVALLRGRETLAVRRQGTGGPDGAATVLPDIDAVLREASVAPGSVGLLAAAVGPGSFTGIRAGLATVKALSSALGVRAAGVPTLHALAYASGAAGRVYALVPAGRGEYFAQFLSVEGGGGVLELGPPAHARLRDLVEGAAGLGPGLRWALAEGSGAAEEITRAWAGYAGGSGPPLGDGSWEVSEVSVALAPAVASLAIDLLARGRVRPPDPLYVRPSDAESKVGCHARNS